MRIVPGVAVALALGGAALSGSCGARKIDDPGALQKFLAGKEISPAKQRQTFMLSEKFFANGTWERWFAFIDITKEKGIWTVRKDGHNRLLVCVTIENSGERKMPGTTECNQIEAYSGAKTATLTTISDPSHTFEVTVSEIKR